MSGGSQSKPRDPCILTNGAAFWFNAKTTQSVAILLPVDYFVVIEGRPIYFYNLKRDQYLKEKKNHILSVPFLFVAKGNNSILSCTYIYTMTRIDTVHCIILVNYRKP